MTSNEAMDHDLSGNIKENFNARRKWEKALLVSAFVFRPQHA